jgi:hypothetical protein
MYISFDASLEVIELLRREMETFVQDTENRRDWQSDIVLRCLGVGSIDKLQLQLEVRCKVRYLSHLALPIDADDLVKLGGREYSRKPIFETGMCSGFGLGRILILGPGGGGAF